MDVECRQQPHRQIDCQKKQGNMFVISPHSEGFRRGKDNAFINTFIKCFQYSSTEPLNKFSPLGKLLHQHFFLSQLEVLEAEAFRRFSYNIVIYPTILSPTIERISVLRKNTLQKVAGSWKTKMPNNTAPTAPMPVQTG